MVYFKRGTEDLLCDNSSKFLENMSTYKDRDISLALIKNEISYLGEVKNKRMVSLYQWYQDLFLFDDSVETFLFFDTETAHLNGFAVSIALIKTDREFNIIEEFYVELNPGVIIDPETIEVHGLTDEMVKDAASFSDYSDKISEMINSSDVLIAHNAIYDIGVLVREYERMEIMFPTGLMYFLDTMNALKCQMAFTGKKKSPSLSESAIALGLDLEGIQLHNALDDTKLLLEVVKIAVDKEDNSIIDNK